MEIFEMKTAMLIFIVLAVLVGGYFLLHKSTPTEPVQTDQTSPGPSLSLTPTPVPGSNDNKIIKATVVTARGNIELELYPAVAPNTVANFIKLSQTKFYDGTKFHRVVANFVIQGGDPLSKTDDPNVGSGGPSGPGYPFADEINPRSLGVPEDMIKQLEQAGYSYNYNLKSLPVAVGAIAMANSGPNTNGSQFFIVTTTDQPHLNGRHTVFGKVIKGMDIVRVIKQGDIVKTIEIK